MFILMGTLVLNQLFVLAIRVQLYLMREAFSHDTWNTHMITPMLQNVKIV